MDKLTNKERLLAWESAWHPSFDGLAIVEEDGTFRSANPKFYELLGITPALLKGVRFQDITPIGIRDIDEQNAKMLVNGEIIFYLLPKSYQFADGRVVKVILLVTRAPREVEEPFQFFVARIMLDENGEPMRDITTSIPSSPRLMERVADFLINNAKVISSLVVLALTALATFFGLV